MEAQRLRIARQVERRLEQRERHRREWVILHNQEIKQDSSDETKRGKGTLGDT